MLQKIKLDQLNHSIPMIIKVMSVNPIIEDFQVLEGKKSFCHSNHLHI